MSVDKASRRLKIRKRTRSVISGSGQLPRLAVFRSNSDIYVQLIDDSNGTTVTSVSSKELKSMKSPKLEVSKEVGKLIAQKAKDNGISTVVFDRGGYLYHGRVKALAEGAREGGLIF
ncbi:MAG: 50S ribosomal protein L18 [Cytophagales bacterium]